MQRPCDHPDTPHARPGPWSADQCHVCWLSVNVPQYAELFGEPAPTDPQPMPNGRPVAPCVHLGDPLTGREREAAGVDHARDWRRCELGLSVGGSPPGIVCSCRGCGPSCPGYAADDS